MKKVRKFSLIAVLALVMSICLGACGANNPLAGDEVVGVWALNNVEYQGITLSNEDLTAAISDIPEITINEDGTCVFRFDGKDGAGEVTKSEDGSKYIMSDGNGSSMEFTIKDGVLKLDYPSSEMVMNFEPTTKSEE